MSVPTAEQSALLSTLEDVASTIQKAQVNLKKCPKARLTEGYLRVRLNTLQDYWITFKDAHNALSKCTPREQRGEMPYFLNEEFYKYEELYLCLQGDITDLLSTIERQRNENIIASSNVSIESHNSHPGQSSLSRLPRIQLPIFGGRYEDWTTYQDLFQALVHNTSLSNVQKLHYLKTSVSGEAEVLLRHIQITDSNYVQAWELLKGRFGNKKMIVTSLLKRLFNQKKVINQSASQIKLLLDTTTECIQSLNNLNIKTDSWDPLIIFLVSQKLDTESLKYWEQYAHKHNSDELPTWNDLKTFLESTFRTLELINPYATTLREKPQTQKAFHITNKETYEDTIQSSHASVNQQLSCTFCKGGHYIYNCKDFAKQSIEQRRSYVKNNRLCYNCLVPNHNVYACKQKTSCRICGKRHHSLLHEVRENKQRNDNTLPQPEQIITTAHFSQEQTGHEVLLATAQVEVQSSNGEKQILRALIDQGSEASFISSGIVELLGLKKTNINGVVSGVGEGTQVSIKHMVDLSVSSRFKEGKSIQVKAYVLKKISTNLPSKHIAMNWPQLRTLKTCLGWILSGQREDKGTSSQHNIITLHITRKVAEDNDILRRFWEIETELYKPKKILTKEETLCEEIYKNTTKRDETGRYIVHLPLKQSIEATVMMCGETKQQAITRLKQLERRFERDPNFKTEYAKVIHEYQEMGHMKKSETPDDVNAIYLPHHAVIREDKETSRVRVVYDASAKGTNHHSLNETMMVGPVLQPDLRSLIITWRKHKICVVGDIVKMYRMIRVTDEHANLQRIVWRDTPDEEIATYILTTVTFGTSAAPYLAVKTLNQLAEDEAHDFPDTAPVIKRGFFMDDYMGGNDTVEQTKTMCKEIREILRRGGFNMQKWSSNSEEVLEYLQEAKSTKNTIEIKLDKIIRILGLTWNRKDDTFKITVNLPEMTYPVTKRTILSDIARLFDPFGWLSPVVITAKILMQRLWSAGLEWDDIVPPNLREEWINYRNELTHLQTIQIPRWFRTTNNNKNVQIHGFSDASTLGFAAATYLRVVDGNNVYVALISSRTRVAPLKQLSVPKLELSAAALLADQINDLLEVLHIPKNQVFAWTDSMVVLSWLQSQPNRWRTFVANRVADIIRVVDKDRWGHVQSVENPADIATRGIHASELSSQELWWNGPKWLSCDKIELNNYDIPQTDLEIKNSLHTVLEAPEEEPIWERFSTLSKMKRILAYCRRFKKDDTTEKREKYLTLNEMEKVLENCIRFYQQRVYGKEIQELKKDGRVKKRSSLITFSPFLDDKELIRLGGRLQNASIAETTKHPIIIPNNQHITKLIVNEAHSKTLHGGIQLMMSYVRTRYWVIGLKSAVKKCIRQCKVCIIDKAKVKTQFMGQLPTVRVTQHRPFINSGVDYAGPIWIRTSKGRGHHATKGYICLFVCMATRAIHLEAVTDLTSSAFLATFRRFVARRGRCLNLWSDNGGNFVRADKELQELLQARNKNWTREVAEQLANEGTTWHFIPPRMPNCGGLWEAGVQSAKKHLTRVNKDTKLTYEELSTLLAQIEACLNSRPLCELDNTPNDPLTPGHFLIGEALISVPDNKYVDMKISLLSRWQLVQRLTQDFWRRWQSEYLNTLQQRYKWQDTIPAPEIGDVIIIKDENLPPTKWLLGRIKYLHPGTDHQVRVVTVQCKGDHELKRPLSKIIPLPKERV